MNKILVPTDFSTVADNALHYAVQLATELKLDIILFHAGGPLSDAEDIILREKTLLLRSSYPMVNFDSVVSPKLFNSQSIQELFPADIIAYVVIGTQGSEASYKHKIFGTNAAEVVEESVYPVIVVPHTVTFKAIGRIAFASDNKSLQLELPRVVKFARSFKAHLDILHIEEAANKEESLKAGNLRHLLQDTAQSDYDLLVTFTTDKKESGDDLLECIENFVEQKKADLLILFHENYSGIRRFFHTGLSEKAATTFKFPLLVFQKQPLH